MKKKSVILAILLSSILCITGCDSISLNKSESEEVEDKRVTVKCETPTVSSIAIDDDFIGIVESEEQVAVVSKLSGDVTDTFFEVGDYVNAGDLLFTIDDTAAQISYKQAQASLTSANASLNTAKAGVNTANANVNYQTASATENVAKTSTTDEQLNLAIKQAEVNFANNEVNIGTLENTLRDLWDKHAKLEEAINAAKASAPAAQAAFVKAQVEYDVALGLLRSDPGNAAYNLRFVLAEEAVNATKAGISSITTLESQMEQLNSSIKQTEASLKTARNSNCLIVDQANLARDQKSDYDTYTKNTIGSGSLASIASAEAGVVQAEAGVVQSKAGISQAQAAVDAAQLQLDYAKVTAPVSGIITSKGVTKNNMTSTGSVAYMIMSDDTKYVSFNVSEKVMKALSEGQSVKVDNGESVYEAVITENPGVVDQQSGLFKVKARINGGEDIVNGLMVKITMTTQRSDNVMTVPIDAVYHENEKSYVYLYNGGVANKAYVETGLFDDSSIEIISGLNADDQVITTWSSQLRNGVEVIADNSVSMDNSQTDGILIERE